MHEAVCLVVTSKKYPSKYSNFCNNFNEYTPVNSETLSQILEKVWTGLGEIITNEDGNVLIVTHSLVIKCILANLKNLPIKKSIESTVYTPYLFNHN